MARNDPAMPFYVNDWLSSPRVSVMTLEQQGAYLRLLCYGWASQEAAIPDDDSLLAALSGMGEGWLKGGCQLVRDCFEPHPHKPGYLTNRKLLELWRERLEWRRKSSVGGQKSAETRRKLVEQKGMTQMKGGSRLVGECLQPNANTLSPSLSPSSVQSPVVPKKDPAAKPKSGGSGCRVQGIDADDLKDTGAVFAWLTANAQALRIDADDHRVQREVLTCAEQALRTGKKPGGLFVELVKQFAAGKSPSLTSEAEDRAKRRHSEWLRRPECGSATSIVQGLADKLTSTTAAGAPA